MKLLRKFVKSKKLIIVYRSVLTSQRPLVMENLSTSTYTFQFGLQSFGLIRVKESMMTERAIELVLERLHEYALSLNDDIVSTITDGASIMMKFGRETEPLDFSCLARAMHLSVCDVLYTEKPKQISDECRNGGNTGNAIANDESDGEENAEEKSDEQECDEEQQNCLVSFQKSKKLSKK